VRTPFLISLVAGLCLATSAAGQGQAVPGAVLERPPTIDGVIDEEEWAAASAFQGLLEAETGEPGEEGGQFWLAYDSRFVYFAARLADAQPHRIQATEYRTNVSLRGNDTVSLRLDPFGTLADFNVFSINPRGATNIEIAGGRAAKREWLGEILAAGRITETGWEVEARIPWAVMRLPAAGPRDLRFNVVRDHRRLQRTFTWAFTRGGRVENMGRWTDVEIPPAGGRRLLLLPYTYGGYDEDGGVVANSGLDLRTALTERLEFVGSINPDFRNVERQVLSLDFSYFERLPGETRPFFLEGSQFFRTSRDAPLFASQRIANFDVGAKAFGKLDDATDVGVLDTIDFGRRNVLVSKIRRQMGVRSNADLAYVRLDDGPLSNQAGFASYSHGMGPFSAFGSYSHTDDTEFGRGHRINTGMFYSDGIWTGSGEYTEISPHFLPRVGFAPERDFRGGSLNLNYSRRSAGTIRDLGFGVSGGYFRRTDGSPYRQFAGLGGGITLFEGVHLQARTFRERFRGFDDAIDSVEVQFPRGNPYQRVGMEYQWGRVADAPYRNVRLTAAYRPLPMLQLAGSYQVVDRLRERVDQVILTASYDLGADYSISGRLVQRVGDTNAYVALRRSGLGAEYFLILGDPSARTFRSSVVLKAVFPFDAPLGRLRSAPPAAPPIRIPQVPPVPPAPEAELPDG
jgi:hypothetical protein